MLFVFIFQREKDFSVQHSTLVNRAYSTLQNPLDRGLYLLVLNEASLELRNETLPPQFLDEIMSINEDLIEAETVEEIHAVGVCNQARIDKKIEQISAAFKRSDRENAKQLLLRLKYYMSIQDKVKESLRRVV